MIAASWPSDAPLDNRMLVVDPRRAVFADARVRDLETFLRSGDVLVVNDAATLPGSLRGTTTSGAPIEVRLAGEEPDASFRVVLFGEGDFRTPTEHRPPPPRIGVGDRLELGPLVADVLEVDGTGRLARVRFEGGEERTWAGIYAHGRPIQYAHVRGELPLFHVQNAYASRPWAVELPSAGRSLAWELLFALRRRGVVLARVTHAAGISSTGDPRLDRTLPWPERFEVPDETARAIERAHAASTRVIAVGTSVVRALESAVGEDGVLRATSGVTDRVLGSGSRLRAVDGVLTGVHEVGTSHRALLAAFAPEALLASAYAHAEEAGYRGHEFGDATLVLGA